MSETQKHLSLEKPQWKPENPKIIVTQLLLVTVFIIVLYQKSVYTQHGAKFEVSTVAKKRYSFFWDMKPHHFVHLDLGMYYTVVTL